MKSKILIITGLVIVAFGAGYLMSQNKNTNSDNITTTTEANNRQIAENNPQNATLANLVSYTLPKEWEENICKGSDASFITPNATTINCDTKLVSPINLSIDKSNNTDCNQLQNQSDVKKHTCISLFINGKKTLKSSTEFLASGPFSKEMVVDAYYFDSGNGVIKAEYVHAPDDAKYQNEFEIIANSLQAK